MDTVQIQDQLPEISQIQFEDPMNMVRQEGTTTKFLARLFRDFRIATYINKGTKEKPNWGVICLIDGKSTRLPICSDGLYTYVIAPEKFGGLKYIKI